MEHLLQHWAMLIQGVEGVHPMIHTLHEAMPGESENKESYHLNSHWDGGEEVHHTISLSFSKHGHPKYDVLPGHINIDYMHNGDPKYRALPDLEDYSYKNYPSGAKSLYRGTDPREAIHAIVGLHGDLTRKYGHPDEGLPGWNDEE